MGSVIRRRIAVAVAAGRSRRRPRVCALVVVVKEVVAAVQMGPVPMRC
jgi:hypothetical protein